MDTSAQKGNGKIKKPNPLDTRVMPKEAKRKPRMYLKVQEIGSHVGQVSASLQNFVFNHLEESEREIHMKRMYLTVFSLFLLIVLGVVVSKKSQAETAMFYPSSCLGGWTNVGKAAGKPDAEEEYTNANSAMLPQNTTAELFCGGFLGEIPENKDPKVLILRIAWTTDGHTGMPDATTTIVGSDFASSSGIILDATGTPAPDFQFASSTESNTQATSTDSFIESTSSPQSGTSRTSLISFLKHVFISAYAQEEATTTTAIPTEASPIAPQSDPQSSASVIPSMGIATSPIDTPHESTLPEKPESILTAPIDTGTSSAAETGLLSTSTDVAATSANATTISQKPSFFEVEYTFDGVTWILLGGIAIEDLKATQFEIPIPKDASWDDLSKLQVHVKRTENTDQSPVVFLDGMTLEVEVKDLEGRKKNQAITNIINENDMITGSEARIGEDIALHVKASSTYGVVLYNASGTLLFTSEVRDENYFPITALSYGTYILVATEDRDWCADASYEECKNATSTYIGQIIFDIARPLY